MKSVIKKVGNSLGLIIPSKTVKEFGLKEGNVIQIPFIDDVKKGDVSIEDINQGDSKMSREFALLIEHSVFRDRAFSKHEIQGFLNVSLKSCDKIIGVGLVHDWIEKITRGREVYYSNTINGRYEAECILGKKFLKNNLIVCAVCHREYNPIKFKNCPSCEFEESDRLRLIEKKKLKRTEKDFRADIRSQLEVHKEKPVGNPVLEENTLPAVVGEGNLPVSIVLPVRKSVPSCVVSGVDPDAPQRSAFLNQGFNNCQMESEKNGKLIPIFREKLLSSCPKHLYDEYKAVCEILFQQDCKILDSSFWRFRAKMFLERNSKILPGLRGKKEKVEFLCAETGNVLQQYVDFRLEAERVAAGKVG